MLQTPQNAFPHNVAVDGTSATSFNFSFRGSILKKYQLKIYENNTGTLTYTSSLFTITGKYNNELVNITVPSSTYTNGNSYVWKVQLWDETDATITSPSYFFKARAMPVVSISAIADTYTNREITFTGSYSQSNNTPIKYQIWTLYDEEENVVKTSGKIYSSKLEYVFDGLISGLNYAIELTIINQDDVEVSDYDTFYVEYSTPNIDIPPDVEYLADKNAFKISWKGDRQAIGVATGVENTDYNFITDFPVTDQTSVELIDSTIIYDTVSGSPLSIAEDDFTIFMSTCINEKTNGKIVEIKNEETSYHLSLDGYTLQSHKDDLVESIADIFPSIVSGQTVTGVPADDTGYVWDNDDTWDNDKYFTITADFEKQFKISMLPNEILAEEVDMSV